MWFIIPSGHSVATLTSSMHTSTLRPSPVVARPTSAAHTACAVAQPVSLSTMPLRIIAGSPVRGLRWRSQMPDIAWITWSYAGWPAFGPVEPNPTIVTWMRCGRVARTGPSSIPNDFAAAGR